MTSPVQLRDLGLLKLDVVLLVSNAGILVITWHHANIILLLFKVRSGEIDLNDN